MKYSKTNVIIFSILIAVTFVFQATSAPTKNQKNTTTTSTKAKYIPDEYSTLDDSASAKKIGGADYNTMLDDESARVIESSRKKYVMALSAIGKKDTARATKLFEEAMTDLNKLTSKPRIDQNTDFNDLVESIVEDYESFITNIDDLNIESSPFVLRDWLFKGLESMDNYKLPDPQKPTHMVVKSQNPYLKIDSLVIPLPINEYVEKNIAFYTQNKKIVKSMKAYFARSSRWLPMLQRVAREENMPVEIVCLALVESGLNPTIASSAKAVGMWQFIRGTADLYHVRMDEWIDNRRNPEKISHTAMQHLRDLYNEFGDWHLALAAYNCGANGVKRAILKSGIDNPTFWDVRPYLPEETKWYVPKYIAMTLIMLQPEYYGFNLKEIPFQNEYTYDKFQLKEPVSLKILAECANISQNELCDLNSELLQSVTPPDSTYLLKLPSGTLNLFSARFATLTPEQKQPWINYYVQKRETLSDIAQKYKMSTADLAAANNMNSRYKLRKGDKIRVPLDLVNNSTATATAGETTVAEKSDDVAPIVKAEKEPLSEKKTSKSAESSKKYVSHIVKEGETLYSIAQKYGVRLNDLREWNNIPVASEDIIAGSRLVIAQNDGSKLLASSEQKLVKKTISHKVKKGETLSKIADNYNVSNESIKKENKIGKKGIKVGQTLKITINSKSTKNNDERLLASKGDKKTHKVRKGETLSSIANAYNVEESDLKKWNKLKSSKISKDQSLVLYEPKASKGSAQAESKSKKMPKTYTLKSKETLGSVASKFGVSVQTLTKLNKKLNPNKLKPGEKIRLQ